MKVKIKSVQKGEGELLLDVEETSTILQVKELVEEKKQELDSKSLKLVYKGILEV